MIFVTGGTGLLGNCIVRELCSRGEAVRVLCRPGTPRTPFDELDVAIVDGDLSDPAKLSQAIEGCTAVVHSAAQIHLGWQQLEASWRVNVEGTRSIVDACLQHSARLVYVSTVDTLPAAADKQHPIDELAHGGVPKTPCTYVLSKTEAEAVVRRAVRDRDLQAIVVHPGFMLGPYDWKPSSGRMFLEVTKAPLLTVPTGGCSLCDARHVAFSVVQAIDSGRVGEHYILAGENLSYRELWTRMLAVAGRKRPMFPLGPGIRAFGKGIDLVNRWLPIREGDINGATMAMGSLNHYYDSSKAVNELSYRIGDTRQTLRDAWQWLQRFRQ